MKRIQIRKLRGLVAEHPVVVAQFTSDRCMPCRSQEKSLQEACAKYQKYGVKCVSIDVDKSQRGISKLKKQGLGFGKKPKILPSTYFYVDGKLRKITDSQLLGGKRTSALVGYRPNIEKGVKQAVISSQAKITK